MRGDVEIDADDVDGLVACVAVATEPGDAGDVALHPPSLGHSHGAHVATSCSEPLLTKSHS